MTLEAALKEFCSGLYEGPISFVGLDGDEGLLIRLAGSWRTLPASLLHYPRVNLYTRAKTKVAAQEAMRALHSAFAVEAPLVLTDTFTLAHSGTDGLPQPLGRDSVGAFAYTLDLLLAVNQNAEI